MLVFLEIFIIGSNRVFKLKNVKGNSIVDKKEKQELKRKSKDS